ncbi:MAG: M23 family metallopeptidase [Gammaproteobacteria bacterium]|nr:M23 family metallopeptidase [Gammaproteobacteria bacterium]
MWLATIVQVTVPLLLISVIAFTRQPNIPRWVITILSHGMIILYLLISSRWDLSSLYLRVVIPVLFLLAAAWSFRRISKPEEAPGTLNTVLAWTINTALIVLMSGFLWFSLVGYKMPDKAVDLKSPLSSTNVVLNGGASPFLNGHFRVRPQSYALDILGVNALGARKSVTGSHEDLESYVIYGQPVFSPCDGRVSAMIDGKPDLIPPNADTENPAGNHVLIECGDFEILLAHLQERSTRVAIDDIVVTGDFIGRVGNSGNTSEPHLHIHAERGGEPGVILDGNSVPITIEGRFLVRNSVFHSSGS